MQPSMRVSTAPTKTLEFVGVVAVLKSRQYLTALAEEAKTTNKEIANGMRSPVPATALAAPSV